MYKFIPKFWFMDIDIARWAAVARGAVIHGLESIVDTRRLKQHYGVLLSAPFDPDVYDMSTVRFDPLTMLLLADDHVEWFAAKVSCTILRPDLPRWDSNYSVDICRDKKQKRDATSQSAVCGGFRNGVPGLPRSI